MIHVDIHEISEVKFSSYDHDGNTSKFSSINLRTKNEDFITLFIQKEQSIESAKQMIHALTSAVEFMENTTGDETL